MDTCKINRFNIPVIIISIINISMLLLELLGWMFIGFVDLFSTVITIITIITLIGAILILLKKRLGIYLFFSSFIVETIYSQVLGKETLNSFIIFVIVFQVIYAYYIYINRKMFDASKCV